VKNAFKWDCRPGSECARNPFFCGSCGSVDCEVDQNISGRRGRGDSAYITCRQCRKVTEVPNLVFGGRWGAIRAEERAEQWDAEDAGWNAALRGSYVEVAGPGPVWIGFLAYYRRDCASGHVLTGVAVVEVIDPAGSGREAGAVIEVGAACLRRAPSVAEEWRGAQRRRALEKVRELEGRSCGK